MSTESSWITPEPAYISVITPDNGSEEANEEASMIAEIQRLPDGRYWFGATSLDGQYLAERTGSFSEVHEAWTHVTGHPVPGVWISEAAANYVRRETFEKPRWEWPETVLSVVCLVLWTLVILMYVGMVS